MEDFSRYRAQTGTQLSDDELLQLAPSFRDIRELIRQTAPGDVINRTGKITVRGDFPQNTLSFDRYNLENITDIPETKFNFIVRIKNGNDMLYFTSTKYKQKLVESYSKNNPYYVLSTLSQIVKVDVAPILRRLTNNFRTEREEGVQMTQNIFFNISYNDSGERSIEVDYEELVRYIDWVVEKPSQNYDERLLNAQGLLEYNKVDISETLADDREEDEDEGTDDGTDESGQDGTEESSDGSSSGTGVGDGILELQRQRREGE